MSAPQPSRSARTTAVEHVTAVVVTRGRTGYLPAALHALADQTRAPERVVLVDVGATPDAGVAEALHGAGLRAAVLHDPRARAFGEAVRTATGTGERVAEGWLWLLHDDVAPAPTALAELVRAVEAAPSVVVAGPKQHTWTSPARLLEAGLRTSRIGSRITDVEPGEVDQGQYDGRDDVLGVGTAGALVRADVWTALRGTDPALGPYGDGLDLSRRARLAGHRVVLAPGAVVRHAQASYHGLRGIDGDPEAVVDLDADGLPDAADPRRSYRARRAALLHQRLVDAPLPLVLVHSVAMCLMALLRVVVRIAAKEPTLALAEVAAVLRTLARPAAVVRARTQARRTRVLRRRSLRPLQADWRTVWVQRRDRRLSRAAARRAVHAPSELELRELAALAKRRRIGLAATVVLLVAGTVVAFGDQISALFGGDLLVGGDLLPGSTGLAGLWQAATSGWVTAEFGATGPADALLTALLPFAALAGGDVALASSVLVVASVLLSGLGAWFAAGAGTRSVGVRVWAAVVWAALPSQLLAAGEGRVGAVLVHVMLPWFALAVARAVGAQQVDEVLPGMATVVRGSHDEQVLDPEEWPDPEAWARAGVEDARAGRRRGRRRGAEPSPADGARDAEGADDQPSPEAERDTGTSAAGGTETGATEHVPDAGQGTAQKADPEVTDDHRPADDAALDPVPAVPRPTGSIAAAAASSLALALVVADAPALLVPGVLVLLVAAGCAPRGRRRRLVLATVPAVLLLGPTLVEAAGRGTEGLRLLLADPGSAVASTPVTDLERLLGVPADAGTLVPDWLSDALPQSVLDWWPAAAGLAVLVPALVALLRGRPMARAVRLGWFAAALGLAVAAVGARTVVGVADDGTPVTGWAGSGVSFAMAGLLAAAVVGTRGVQARLSEVTFGWRQLTAGVVTLVAVLGPVLAWGSWAWQAHDDRTATPDTLSRSIVPAIGRQTQSSSDAPRVLALTAGSDEVTWQLLRGDGPRLVDLAASTRTRGLTGGLTSAQAVEDDDATAEVQTVVGRLYAGSGEDVATTLGALAVADVLVPALPDGVDATSPEGQARTELVGRLDATAGLERITEGVSGVIWRVQPTSPAEGDTQVPVAVTAWARLVPDSTAMTSADALAGERAVPVASDGTGVDTRIEAGEAGRLLVLAERSGSGWHATLDGRSLRAVTDGWRQTFEVGADGGHLVVAYQPADRTVWTVAQATVLLLAVLLALPVRRRRAPRRTT